jgi:hypothetical protein
MIIMIYIVVYATVKVLSEAEDYLWVWYNSYEH